MSDPQTVPEAPITIKKYANRRLYNTATSSYVTLDHLSQMVKDGSDFVVYDAKSGELTLPWNVLGLPYNEVAVTYTAGLATIGDDVKTACAQIVRNAQSTPALNASKTKIDTMQMQYFSSSLVDETVQAWLRPYVANRLG